MVATPVIEEIFELGKETHSFPWEDFWKHSIGTAIMTREILSMLDLNYEEEADYVAGLLHNLGILILAITFPEYFKGIYSSSFKDSDDIISSEIKNVGWDHAKIGAYYLWNHHISDEIVDAIHWHNNPEKAKESPKLAAAIQVSDHYMSELGFTGLANFPIPRTGTHQQLSGWGILFEEQADAEEIEAKLGHCANRLEQTLNGIL